MLTFRVNRDTTGIMHGSRFSLSKINRIYFCGKHVHKTTAFAGGCIHYAELNTWVIHQ